MSIAVMLSLSITSSQMVKLLTGGLLMPIHQRAYTASFLSEDIGLIKYSNLRGAWRQDRKKNAPQHEGNLA